MLLDSGGICTNERLSWNADWLRSWPSEVIDPAIAKKLISFPDNSKNSFRLNGAWYAEAGADGKTNTARLVERWNTWIVQ